MASSALRSALRSTACMQAVDLKTKLLLRLTGRRRRSVGSCGATPGPRRFGMGATSLSGLSNWPSAGAGDGRFKLARQTDLRNCVGESLAMGHSPEQIAGRLAQEHGRVIISHRVNLSFHLSSCGSEGLLASPAAAPQRRRGRRRRPGGSPAGFIKQRRSITERPTEVEGRGTAGHWEADFMLFLDVAKGCWFSTNEKPASASFIIRSIEKLSSPPELSLVNSANSQRRYRKTISFDNGNEFAEHHRLHKTIGVQTFFCDPHSPWQKGGVENSIGRLRRSLPRKTDLNLITAAALKRHVQRLNDTPRKCLDFKTPAEAFSKLKSIVALQT